MRIIPISLLLCASLFGAGCAKGPGAVMEKVYPSQPAQRVLPAPPAEPISAPEVPEAAKNIPRPQ